jgi:hypothetical protein
VEELFLRALLAADELNVVDEQHVDGAVALAEGGMRSKRIELMSSLTNCSATR